MGNLFDQSRDKSRVSRQNLILKAFYEATSSPFRVPLMLTLFTFHSIRKGSYHAVSFSIGSRQFAERMRNSHLQRRISCGLIGCVPDDRAETNRHLNEESRPQGAALVFRYCRYSCRFEGITA